MTCEMRWLVGAHGLVLVRSYLSTREAADWDNHGGGLVKSGEL